MKKTRLLIIPAKSSSQRIKNKNFKNFCGKPIIEYPLQAAKKSAIFDKIHISTESQLVKKRLSKKRIIIDFLRPKRLAKNNIGLFEVYKFIVNKYKQQGLNFDEVWTLLPCSPLIDHLDLIKLKKDLEKKKLNKPIISVSRYNAPVQWAFTLNSKNKKLSPLYKKKQIIPSQKFKPSYYDTGSIAIFNSSNFNTNKKFYSKNFYGYELPPEKNVDIDNHYDWKFAEYLKKLNEFLKKKKIKKKN